MFKKMLGSRGGAAAPAPEAPTSSTATALPTRPTVPTVVDWVPPVLPEVPVPPVDVLQEQWRQEVARVCLDLRERHPTLEHGHGERLLVKLAVDLEFTVRQPS